jgi:trehalose-phosphatase
VSTELRGVPEAFWREAAAAPRHLLALDYDGTLAPFRVDPATARPLPAARRALERVLARGTEVAVVSGRPPADVVRLLDAPPLVVVGEHGWTLRRADGGELRHPVPPELTARLDRAEGHAAQLAPARVERKRASLVIHTRGLAPGLAAEVERRALDRFAPLLAGGLALRPIAGGLELRVRGRDKGVALAELAAESGPGVFVAAVGDDDTDEDAFRAAARAGGWGVRVGSTRPTAARATLASPHEVARFLELWAERIPESGAKLSGRLAGSG